MDEKKVCVIGAGISGLVASTVLSSSQRLAIDIIEASGVAGGRANVIDGAEHCPRLFLNDYFVLYSVLNVVHHDGRPLIQALKPTDRYVVSPSRGLIRINHVYTALASDLSLRDKLRMLSRRQRSILAADRERHSAQVRQLRSQLSWRALRRLFMSAVRSTRAFSLDGSTHDTLIAPWIQHLQSHGVGLELGLKVLSVSQSDDHQIRVVTEADSRLYDAVVMTGFAPDLHELAERSGFVSKYDPQSLLRAVSHTYEVDPSERTKVPERAIVTRDQVTALVQPGGRLVALCTNPSLYSDEHASTVLRETLGLDHEPNLVGTRLNRDPNEQLFASLHLHPDAAVEHDMRGLEFAGSHFDSSYPVDSAECAASTAVAAAKRVAAYLGVTVRIPPTSVETLVDIRRSQ